MTTPTQNTEVTPEPASPPVAKIRVSLITASIWQRTNEHGAFYSATFERRYRDRNGEWRTSHSYDGGGDVRALAKAADLADTKILELQAGE